MASAADLKFLHRASNLLQDLQIESGNRIHKLASVPLAGLRPAIEAVSAISLECQSWEFEKFLEGLDSGGLAAA